MFKSETGYFRKKYESLCSRIYSVGKKAFEQNKVSHLYRQTTTKSSSFLYPSADVVNLQESPMAIQIGENCHIFGQLTVYKHAGKILIGDHCSLGDLSRIVSGKSISIGNRVLISHNVNILDNNSHPLDARLRHEDYINNFNSEIQEYDLKGSEIVIEDDVWIGFNSIILKGVTIGKGAIIGAGSIVIDDVAPWTVNVGNPLRVVRKLEPLNS